MKAPTGLTTHGHVIPREFLGELRDSAGLAGDGEALRARLAEDGYLFLRGALDRAAVLAAREEVFARLAEVGEIGEPASEGISTGTSRRAELISDFGAFWKSVCNGPRIRSVTHAGPIVDIMQRILGGEVRPFDFLWLRAMHPGRASAFHFDHVYMNRGTSNLFTVWTPLGDIELVEGPILLLENSHTWTDLINQYRGFDVDKDTSRPGHVTLDAVALARERGARLLTAEFRAGDAVIFPMFTLHGSLDNRSPIGRVRLSSDARYQLASEPVDERWVGENPIAHGKGYESVGGAQPATSAPIRR
jgi:ectoine hydroxylase-related dioxygenase (phytanoyl-CoA dioxygenase family)